MGWSLSDARAASSRARNALLRFADRHCAPGLIDGEGADLGVPPGFYGGGDRRARTALKCPPVRRVGVPPVE